MDKKSQVQIAYSKLTNKAQNNFTCFVKISFLIFFFLFFLFIGYFFFLIENLNVQKAKSLLLFFLYFFFYLSVEQWAVSFHFKTNWWWGRYIPKSFITFNITPCRPVFRVVVWSQILVPKHYLCFACIS